MARQWIRDSRLQSSDWSAIRWCLGGLGILWGPLLALHLLLEDQANTVYVGSDTFPTLLEVIPAVVVAVAIFTAGTLFVIAELISATLGSRAVLRLLNSGIARAGVIIGMMLLLASLAGAMAAKLPEEGPVSALWSSFAVALAVATGLYAALAMRMLVAVVWTFVDPSAYSRDLARPLNTDNAQEAVEDLYQRVRSLRQWLRTAASSGESRDLQFALLGLERLLLEYRRKTRTLPEIRTLAPAEYRTSRLDESEWTNPHEDADDQDKASQLQGWFGNEVGRALVRGLEVGLRGQLLRRDADRILDTIATCISITCDGVGRDRPGHEPTADQVLAEEAGFLLDRLTEVGVFCQQIQDPVWRDWFRQAAIRLASFEAALEPTDFASLPPDLVPRPGGPAKPEKGSCLLAGRALVGWCLVQHSLGETHGEPAGLDLLGEAALSGNPGDPVWQHAIAMAHNEAILPSWLPDQVAGNGDRRSRQPSAAWLEYVCRVPARLRLRRPTADDAPSSPLSQDSPLGQGPRSAGSCRSPEAEPVQDAPVV